MSSPLALADGAAKEFSSYWLLLAGCFLGAMCGVSSLYYYTQGLFMKPIGAEFGWSRTVITVGGLLNVLGSAVMAPISGMIIDRIGARRFAAISLLTSAFSLWTLSQLNGSVVQYYLLLILVALLSSGTTMVSFGRAINEWFNSARGLALGTLGAGIGVSAALAPAYFATVVNEQGWRQGYITMALLIVIATPFVWLMMRPPLATAQQASAHALRLTQGLTATEAVRTVRFRVIAAMLFTGSLAASAIIVHFVPMLTDGGMTPQRAATYAAVIGVSITFSRFFAGYLLDRFFAPSVALIAFSLAALGALLLAMFGAPVAWLAACLFGFALGTEGDLTGYMTARYFGIRAYGFIYGALYASFLTGIALGPVLAGIVFDTQHNYQLALYGATGAFVLAAILATRLGPYPQLISSPSE